MIKYDLNDDAPHFPKYSCSEFKPPLLSNQCMVTMVMIT